MKYFELRDDIVISEYANDQKGIVLIKLPENDARVIAFRNPVKSLDEQKREFYNVNGQTESAFIQALIQERSLQNNTVPVGDFFNERSATRDKSDFPK